MPIGKERLSIIMVSYIGVVDRCGQKMCTIYIYSRKYWRRLINLAVEPKIAITRILADNLVVWYGIAIRIHV